MDSLPRKAFGDSSTRPPLRYYGWPYKKDRILEYAKRHHLHFSVPEPARCLFGGKEEMDFAELSDEHYEDPELLREVHKVAVRNVALELSRVAGLRVRDNYLLCKDFDGILYVWDNYSTCNRLDSAKRMRAWAEELNILRDAMLEMMGEESKPQWWHSWKNWVSHLSSFNIG